MSTKLSTAYPRWTVTDTSASYSTSSPTIARENPTDLQYLNAKLIDLETKLSRAMRTIDILVRKDEENREMLEYLKDIVNKEF